MWDEKVNVLPFKLWYNFRLLKLEVHLAYPAGFTGNPLK